MSEPNLIPIDHRSATHYLWGGICEGWRYLDEGDMSVILERLPDGASEQAHSHRRVRQLFFVLEGEASMELGDTVVRFGPRQAVHVPPGTPHRFFNSSGSDVVVLVISSGAARDDRTVLDGGTEVAGCPPGRAHLPPDTQST